jgi:hypothetical protein
VEAKVGNGNDTPPGYRQPQQLQQANLTDLTDLTAIRRLRVHGGAIISSGGGIYGRTSGASSGSGAVYSIGGGGHTRPTLL